MPITSLRLRGILDSRAQHTIEADLRLGGIEGRGSSPVAIKPGRLERARGPHARDIGDLTFGPAGSQLVAALADWEPTGQLDLDTRLAELDEAHGLGADVTLAVSLAYARAAAACAGLPLHGWMARLAGTSPGMPRLLVNAFSGGIHRGGQADSFQQVMLIPKGHDLLADVRLALVAYDRLERLAENPGVSASSGLLVPGRDTTWQLDALAQAGACPGGQLAVGIDVAAEHLAAEHLTAEHLADEEQSYRFEGARYDSAAFAELLLDLADRYRIDYIEDPFDPADTAAWESFLTPARAREVTVVGDDLFATSADRIRRGLADAVLLKLSQAGTLTGTLKAAQAARAAGLGLVVSHRSGETEDCAMCDLAVAVKADYIKVGGPRRGDRIAKYNQLLRLAEDLTLKESANVPCQAVQGIDARA